MTGEQSQSLSAKICPKCNRQYPDYAAFCTLDAAKLTAVAHEHLGRQTQLPKQPLINSGPQSSVVASGSHQGPPAASAAKIPILDSDTGYSSLIGRTIDGKYQVESVLGEGGMAVVYRANHLQMERIVVIKVMQGWLLSNKNSGQRFERECKLTAKLNHPNIVSVYDVGKLNEAQPYLVMEYIKGEALADKLGRQGAQPVTTAGNIIVQICRGLQEAHNQGIIHRDLKPENVLLQEKADRPDWVKIVDFGISHAVEGSKRLTKTGKMIGTPEYIAPEQLRDRAIDVRTDIYSLGVMMFEILTGKVPFSGESAEAVLMKHLLEEPPPLSSMRDDIEDDSAWALIVKKALEKNPDDRYQTVTELRLDVEQALNQSMLKRG